MESTRTVQPVKPAAPYIGGKRNLAQRLVAMIEAIPHDLYAEPFVGMGGVFFRRTQIPRAEVINDFSRDVATFFRVLQVHYVAFVEMMRFQLTMRDEFERLVNTRPETLTDMQRAARFLYLQRTTFGGKVAGRSFGVTPDRPGRFDVTKLVPMLEDLHARLAGIVIECLPYGEFIQRYDRPNVLFFLDPPYYDSEGDYGRDAFSRADFEHLAEALKGLSGAFLMTINDVPEIRRIFAGFNIEAVTTTYSIARKKGQGKGVGELIISNMPAARYSPGRTKRRGS